jgi:DNA-binding NarL/FixJ family response regulator
MHVLILVEDAALASVLYSSLLRASHAAEIGGNVPGVLRQAEQRHHEVLVLGRRSAGLDGIEATSVLRRRGITTPILMVGASLSVADRVRALDAGADDALRLRGAHAELLARIHALARRAAVARDGAISPTSRDARWRYASAHSTETAGEQLSRSMVEYTATHPPDQQRWPASVLSARQRQVLQLVAEGLTNEQIASSLRITPRTARFHVAAVLVKLGAGNRAQAAALGAHLGLFVASSGLCLVSPHP